MKSYILATETHRSTWSNVHTQNCRPIHSWPLHWVLYTVRLQQYFVANNVDSATKQHAILPSSCGADTCQIIHNLVAPSMPNDKSFKQIVDLVKAHYCLQPSVIVPCFTFNNWVQKEGKATTEFMTELCHIS